MKTKARYGLIAAAGIVVAIALVGVAITSFVHSGVNFGPAMMSSYTGDGNIVEVKAHKSLDVEGIWDLTIKQGEPKLLLYADQDAIKKLRIDESDTTLSLAMQRVGLPFGRGVRAEITMPDLNAVHIKGGARIEFDNIKAADFSLQLEGGSSVNSNEGSFDRLTLKVDGASRVDLSKSTVTNADVTLRGATVVDLAMNGGSLSGSVSGVGKLSYSGTVSSQDVHADGLAKVEHE